MPAKDRRTSPPSVLKKKEKYTPSQKHGNHRAPQTSPEFEHRTRSRLECRLCKEDLFLRECPNLEKAQKLLMECEAQTKKAKSFPIASSKPPVKTAIQKNRNKKTGKA